MGQPGRAVPRTSLGGSNDHTHTHRASTHGRRSFEALRRCHRARRRRTRPVSRRSPRTRRRERRRQVHPHQGPDRRLPRPTRAQITYLGEPISLSSPRDAWDIGISTTFQEITLVPLMSVARNLYLGNEPRAGGACSPSTQMNRTADRAVAPLRHRHRRPPPGRSFGAGVQQMIAIVRAVSTDAACGDPRRADGLARAARGRPVSSMSSVA